MAKLITEPEHQNPGTEDWLNALLKMTMTTGGLAMIGLTNIDNSQAPQIMAGSRVEINGSFYKCDSNESISGTPTNNAVNYVYAVPNGGVCSFQYLSGNPSPAFDPAKGGWYNGNNRAIAKLFYTGTQYNGKVILDSYNAMYIVNNRQPLPATGGKKIVEVTAEQLNQVLSITLPAGAYRYEMKAGTGGNGGPGQYSVAYEGGAGADGESREGTFFLDVDKKINYFLGGDGAPGAPSSGGGYSATGGGSTGFPAFIDILQRDIILAQGGSGGGGGSSSSNGAASGGGGGGGYGRGADGEGYRSGRGGHSGIGGNTDNADSSGGGGSGTVSGGTAGSGGGSSGGGYGLPGGTGGSGAPGGLSSKLEILFLPNGEIKYSIPFQGGGGGGSSRGGTGGGEALSTTSGYLRIYQMW